MVRLERATDADVPAIVALANLAFRGEDGWTSEHYIAGQRIDDTMLRADLAAKPGACVLLRRDDTDGALIGTVWLEPLDDGAWYLGLLTVRPDIQAAGLDRTILEEAEAFVIAAGGERIRMTVINIRATLIAWYERRGYTLTGETGAFPYGDDRFGRPLRDDLAFVYLEKTLGR